MNAVLVTTSRETLVFRDGRPFGKEGTLTGGLIPWPMPSTVAGMIRSRIGLAKGPEYFSRANPQRPENLRKLLAIGLRGLLPVQRRFGTSTWQFLFPAPADAAIFPAKRDSLSIERFACTPLAASGEGCADVWANWLLPITQNPNKPASKRPAFWHEAMFFRWLREDNLGELPPAALGIAGAEPDTRIHTAIDPSTGTVLDGALFDAPGIRLGVRASHGDQPSAELGLAVFLDGLEPGDDATGPAHLGGERRVAYNDPAPVTFAFPAAPPELKEACHGQRFLRLVLTSPGSFGDWAPAWLLPEPGNRIGETPWRDVPGTDLQVRLRSAFVPTWTPLSGWNYAEHAPKAMRKIVPAGAVYVVEIRHPAESATVAAALWGRSLCDDLQAARDGFGTAVVGAAAKFCAGAT